MDLKHFSSVSGLKVGVELMVVTRQWSTELVTPSRTLPNSV